MSAREQIMPNNNQTVFISGANRGIGFELARQLVEKSYQVIAGYRDEGRSQELLEEARQTRNLYSVQVDVTSADDLVKLYEFVVNRFDALDILINNAGINLNRDLSISQLDFSGLAHHFEVNVGGVFQASRFLYPLIEAGRGKKIINISSKLASIELSSGNSIAYSVSKAALNMLTKNQSVEYGAAGITVISLSPGWVRTDMGGGAAPLSVRESVTRMLQVIDKLSLAQTGQFMDLNGDILPY